jgi:hypothetical protein
VSTSTRVSRRSGVGADQARRFEPVEPRHADVRQHAARQNAAGEVEGLAAVGRFACDLLERVLRQVCYVAASASVGATLAARMAG